MMAPMSGTRRAPLACTVPRSARAPVSVKMNAACAKCSLRLGEPVYAAIALRSAGIGWQQEDFAIAAVGIGREDRGQRSSHDRPPEHQISVGEHDACVSFGDFDVAHPVALAGIEPGGENGAAEVCGGLGLRPCAERKRD